MSEGQPVPKSDGYKLDSGKAPMTLLPMRPLIAIARVLAFGAQKYGAHSWRVNAGDWSRLSSAALRHLATWNDGEDIDPETGESHLAHAACCVLFLLEYVLLGRGTDDRFKG